MRVLSEPLLTAADASVSQNSLPLLLEFAMTLSIQAVFTGAPAGTIKLQGSVDRPQADASFATATFVPTNWNDIIASPIVVSGAGIQTYAYQIAAFTYVRAVWTPTSGTGSLSIVGYTKGF